MMRQEDAENKINFYLGVIENKNSSNLHRLINKQRKSKSSNSDISLLVNDTLVTDTVEQVKACVTHYHKLSNPVPSKLFDDDYFKNSQIDVDQIRTLISQGEYAKTPMLEDDVTKAISKLKTNKSLDEHGLCSEAFKLTSKYITPILAKLFNSMRTHTCNTDFYKTGIMSSIPKKGKDEKILDNHRGITITPTDVKILEHVLNERIKPNQLYNQEELQLGFTEGVSRFLASLLIFEAIVEARENKKSLYICTLDAKKAFDTVRHSSLLKKM